MSAIIDEIHMYQAVCTSCGWWGERVESEDTADEDAFEHNVEHHDA